MPLNEQVLNFLAGDWVVSRHFVGSYRGSFTGKASLTPQSGESSGYLYMEAGELIDGEGKPFDAKQSYLYRLADEKLQVLKREDSAWIVMHDFDFTQDVDIATAAHVHACGQDHYAATYRIDFGGGWEVAYAVSGPKKDYQIRSVYARV